MISIYYDDFTQQQRHALDRTAQPIEMITPADRERRAELSRLFDQQTHPEIAREAYLQVRDVTPVSKWPALEEEWIIHMKAMLP